MAKSILFYVIRVKYLNKLNFTVYYFIKFTQKIKAVLKTAITIIKNILFYYFTLLLINKEFRIRLHKGIHEILSVLILENSLKYWSV